MRIRHLALLLVLTMLVPATCDAQTESLRIRDIDYRPGDQTLRFVLDNRSEHTVTAWGVEWRATDAFGSTQILGRTVDRIFGAHPPLAPGDSWEHAVRLKLAGNPDLHAIDVELVFAILSSRAVLGDSERAEEVFVIRRAQHAVSSEILHALETSRSARDARTKLDSLNERFDRERQSLGSRSNDLFENTRVALGETDSAWYRKQLSDDQMSRQGIAFESRLDSTVQSLKDQLAKLERGLQIPSIPKATTSSTGR